MSTPNPEIFRGDEDEVIGDAETSVGRTPEERNAMFASIQRLVGSIWDQLSREEMRRRLQIAEELDPRPDPWWRNIRREDGE